MDTAIVTDLLSLAWEGAYDVAILVSSDSDLVPGVERLQEKGPKVINATWKSHGHHLAKASWASFDVDGLVGDLRPKPSPFPRRRPQLEHSLARPRSLALRRIARRRLPLVAMNLPIVHLGIEGVGIEHRVSPLAQLRVLRVLGVGEHGEEVTISTHSTAVLGGAGALAVDDVGVHAVGSGLKLPFQHDRVLPSVAEVVLVNELVVELSQDLAERGPGGRTLKVSRGELPRVLVAVARNRHQKPTHLQAQPVRGQIGLVLPNHFQQ